VSNSGRRDSLADQSPRASHCRISRAGLTPSAAGPSSRQAAPVAGVVIPVGRGFESVGERGPSMPATARLSRNFSRACGSYSKVSLKNARAQVEKSVSRRAPRPQQSTVAREPLALRICPFPAATIQRGSAQLLRGQQFVNRQLL